MSIDPKMQKWLDELRSGKHSQTKGRMLSKRGGMCCLGVYAKCVLGLNISVSVEPGGDDIKSENGKIYDQVRDDIGGRLSTEELTIMNDDGKRFKTIANYIEKELAQ